MFDSPKENTTAIDLPRKERPRGITVYKAGHSLLHFYYNTTILRLHFIFCIFLQRMRYILPVKELFSMLE